MKGPRLLPNIGGEEAGAAPAAAEAVLATVEALWRDLFAPPLPLDGFEEVEAAAWWNSEAARRWADEQGLPLFGGDVEAVARVHDKAFALDVARREGLLPEPFDAAVAFDAEWVRRGDGFVEELRERCARLPEAARGFTLKPRLGSAGRGRVALRAGEDPEPLLRGARERLAEQGGAILEPWVERVADYSTQLHLGSGGVVLLATLEQLTTRAGLVLGHRGLVDSRGRVSCGARCDESLRESAVAMALAAVEAGFQGTCGVDAFSFRDAAGASRLRPIVECNARFTVGLLAMAQVRRAVPEIRERLGLDPGTLRAFDFRLREPTHGWPQDDVRRFVRPGPGGSALIVATDLDSLADVART